MTGKFKAVLTALAVVVLGAALFVPIAGAAGAGTSAETRNMMNGGGHDGWCGGGIWSGSGAWGGTGTWGTGGGAVWLANNPDALEVWLQLKADHLAALQTWRDTYKADLRSAEAQQALGDLWTKSWNDMKAFYEQYGGGATWTCPSDGMWAGWSSGMMGHHEWNAAHMWGTGHGAAWMTSHPRAFGHWLTMRAKQTAAAGAWQHRHGDHPRSAAAQTAWKTMRARQRTQVRTFYRDHHLTVTSSRMRDGAGGWMGLGGMWGGFGW
jgi:hypothetical protein